MSVAKLVGFVDLCRSFGVEVSPAETAAFIHDFNALDMDDRTLLEEGAVGALARDKESEATIRRLFPLYFAGQRPDLRAEEVKGDAEDRSPRPDVASPPQEIQPRQRQPENRDSPRNPQLDPNKPTPDGVEAMAESLEQMERTAEEADSLFPNDLLDRATPALTALRKPPTRPPRKGAPPAAPPMERHEVLKLLREMARQRGNLTQRAQQATEDRQRREQEKNAQNPSEQGDQNNEEQENQEDAGEDDNGQGEQGANGQGAQGRSGQGQQGQNGQGAQGQNGQGQGQGQDGQGEGQGSQGQGEGQGENGEGGQGQGLQGQNGQHSNGFRESNGENGGFGGRGRSRGLSPSRQGELEALVQRLARACAEMVANDKLAQETLARLVAALNPSLSRSFVAQMGTALKETTSPMRQERLREALESIAGRMLAEGSFSNKEAARLLTAADERLKLQTTVSGAGLKSVLHDADALSDLLQRYRQRRDLLPPLVTKLSDALRKLLTRPSPVMARSDSGRLDFRATMRESVAYGGVPLEFRYRRRRQESEVVLALDTSGSQRSWAASAVLTAFALNRLLPRLKAYSFTSDLVEVTKYLTRPERFIEHLEDFSGFSNYEISLLQLEASGALTRRTTLILVGDCRDAQGRWQKEREGRYSRYLHPESAEVVARLVKRCRRVVILNPEDESRWDAGDSAAISYQSAGATVLPVHSPLHLAEQLAHYSLHHGGRSSGGR